MLPAGKLERLGCEDFTLSGVCDLKNNVRVCCGVRVWEEVHAYVWFELFFLAVGNKIPQRQQNHSLSVVLAVISFSTRGFPRPTSGTISRHRENGDFLKPLACGGSRCYSRP